MFPLCQFRTGATGQVCSQSQERCSPYLNCLTKNQTSKQLALVFGSPPESPCQHRASQGYHPIPAYVGQCLTNPPKITQRKLKQTHPIGGNAADLTGVGNTTPQAAQTHLLHLPQLPQQVATK